MNEPMSPADVQTFLEPFGIAVQQLPDDTSTAALAARALDTTVGSIVKSLLFMADGEPVLLLVSGDKKVDSRRLRDALGASKVRMATPAEVLELAGYLVGGVPPVAHRRPLPALMDRHLLGYAVVYAAAGSGYAIFPVEPQRLVEISGARPAEITQ